MHQSLIKTFFSKKIINSREIFNYLQLGNLQGGLS
jgi:hypothetical protein